MVIYLKVNSGSKRYGTLELHFKTFENDVTFGWEWYGGPEGTDGGPCEWVIEGKKVTIELESHDTGMRAVLGCMRWNYGVVPPKTPWFENDFGDYQYIKYKSPKVKKLDLQWWKL